VTDERLALAAVNHSATTLRRLLSWYPLVGIGVVLALSGVLVVLLEATRSSVSSAWSDIATMVLLVPLVLWWVQARRRYIRLYNAGAVALTGGPRRRAGASAAARAEGGPTIPTAALGQIPGRRLTYLPPVVTADGGVELRDQPTLGPITLALAVLTLAGMVGYLVSAVMVDTNRGQDRAAASVAVGTVAVAACAVAALVVAQAIRRLIPPVAARFTHAGWELPPAGISGTWAEVTAIEVYPVRPSVVALATMNRTARMIALRVSDPASHLARAARRDRLRRRAAMRHYGTPVAVLAGPGGQMETEQLLRVLAHYTGAPVESNDLLAPR
jgi:hypothetical protein